MWMHKEYKGFPIYITENGMSDLGGTNDTLRVFYYNNYLDNVLKAISDGANIKGYVAWSLMDNFEWRAGYTERFGLYHVDYKSPNKTRTPKMSAMVYKNIVATNQIDFDFKPKLDIDIETPTKYETFCNNSGVSINISLILLISSVVIKVLY